MKVEPRIERLRAALLASRPQSADEALLLTHLPDIRWLCGFTGSNALFLLLPRAAVLVTDGRYTTQAREEARGVRVAIHKKGLETAGKLIAGAGIQTIGFDAQHTSVSSLRRMEESLPETPAGTPKRVFHPFAASPVAALRQVKDAGELAILREAALLTCKLFEEAALPRFRAGVPERELAAELEYAARLAGAEGMSFETIVAAGPRSALPHGHATAQPIPARGFVTLDFGIMHKGYCSDMTRTVFIGKPTGDERDAYEAVLAAQIAGIGAVRAGARVSTVDRAARGLLKTRGLDKYFTHSTGHGLGLEIHEGPRLAARVDETLAEGMVVTIEPGVYLPGKFGVRIEDMVHVGASGGRILTPAAKELITL